ncbi:MAG: MoaD/ThiS family protein [Candidatus Hodarchaeales archaeon]
MVSIQIDLYGRLGTNLGSQIRLDFQDKYKLTLRQIISKLIQLDSTLKPLLLKNNELRQGTILLINGHAIDRSTFGLDTPITEGDRITIDKLGFLEIVGGG